MGCEPKRGLFVIGTDWVGSSFGWEGVISEEGEGLSVGWGDNEV
jgi:hypothetical protein